MLFRDSNLSVAALDALPVTGVMLFGEDRGQVSILGQELTREVITGSDRSMTLLELDETALRDRRLLPEAFFATILTGERRVIRIRDVDSGALLEALKLLERQLTAPVTPQDTPFILIEMPNMPATNSLRKYVMRSSFLAAFPCYLGKFAQDHITAFLRSHRLSYDADVKEWLEYQLQADTAYVHNEMLRLALYAGSNRTLSLRQVETVIEPHIASRANAVVIAAFAGHGRHMNNLLAGYWRAGGVAEALMATLIRFIFELYAIAHGEKKELPAQFSHFSLRAQSRAAIRTWDGSTLDYLVNRLPGDLYQLRTSPPGADYLITLLLMQIARKSVSRQT